MNYELTSRCFAKFNEVMELAYSMVPRFREYGPIEFFISSNLAPRTIGLATYRGLYNGPKVELNSRFLNANADKVINDTIPHEVAHHLTKFLYPRAKQAHGPEWKAICRALGGNAERQSHANNFQGLEIRTKTRRRWVYQNANGHKIELTSQQHAKCQMGYSFLNKAFPGERWRAMDFTGQIAAYK